MTSLSPHFTLDEAVFSSTALRRGIDNTPPQDVMDNMAAAANSLEIVRAILGRPMHIDSWYRCPDLNAAVGGAPSSAHQHGWAIDFISPEYGTPLEIVHAIVAARDDIRFDQCIQEGNWVHISFDPQMRGRVLTAHFDANGKATYSEGA